MHILEQTRRHWLAYDEYDFFDASNKMLHSCNNGLQQKSEYSRMPNLYELDDYYLTDNASLRIKQILLDCFLTFILSIWTVNG